MTKSSELEALAVRGFSPREVKFKADKPYFNFTCDGCGEDASNTYCEPSYSQMLERKLCFSCNFWIEEEKKYEKNHATMTIIGGHVYSPGNRTSGNFRGMAGRRFDIEYIEPSAYAGQRITTFDLWSGSKLPDHLAAKFPDTAKFIGGAQKAEWPEGSLITTAWNPSASKSETVPAAEVSPRTRDRCSMSEQVRAAFASYFKAEYRRSEKYLGDLIDILSKHNDPQTAVDNVLVRLSQHYSRTDKP